MEHQNKDSTRFNIWTYLEDPFFWSCAMPKRIAVLPHLKHNCTIPLQVFCCILQPIGTGHHLRSSFTARKLLRTEGIQNVCVKYPQGSLPWQGGCVCQLYFCYLPPITAWMHPDHPVQVSSQPLQWPACNGQPLAACCV